MIAPERPGATLLARLRQTVGDSAARGLLAGGGAGAAALVIDVLIDASLLGAGVAAVAAGVAAWAIPARAGAKTAGRDGTTAGAGAEARPDGRADAVPGGASALAEAVPASGAAAARAQTPAPGFGRRMLDRIPMGVVVIDARGHVQLINPAAGRFFGRQPAGSFHMSVLRVPKLLDAIDTALVEGRPSVVTFTPARGVETHLKAHLEPIAPEPPETAPSLLVVIEDHTQAHLAEALHRDFVANASHELKTPLATISGIIETLQGHARGDVEAEARFLSMMATQTERMKRLVEDLLSLNRIELNERVQPNTPQPLDRIVGEVVDSMSPVADAAQMRLCLARLPDLADAEVPGNREELGQLFANLIDNAIKYGHPGPEVTVSLLDGGPERPGQIGVSVADRGRGIAREHIPRLTERFYRVSVSRSREKGGTGLGLAIVKHIVSRHRGELEIESEVGRGSTFTVWLPLAQPRALPTGGAALASTRQAAE